MSCWIIRWVVASCALLGFAAMLCAAQEKTSKPPKQDPALAAGAKLYKTNCAVCHGNDGKGNGPPPASSPFTEPVPDLTTLTERHNGVFPKGYVKSVLHTGISLHDHGPAEMPVWGLIFKAMTTSDEAKVTARIDDLTAYIESLQGK
ncbi:MAG TPA: cytochrome c [Candidatus Baltobacteraceae bacterium]|nr:cytochrome c [Candidatus Baltobacteraceae bacterium]